MSLRLKVLFDGENAGLKASAAKAQKDLQGVKREAERTTDVFEKMRPAILGIAGSLAGAFTIYELSRFADEAANVRNRIRDVTGSVEEFNKVQSQLRDIANDSRQSLSATAELFARVKRATGDLLQTNEEVADVVETLNKAFAVSGASAQEASNAIIQLSQGLQSGVLRGDEFNSVAEQAPVILKAVEVQTGKTRAEIRELAADGKITSELLIKSIQNYASEVDRRFNQAEQTISQAFTISRNNVLAYISDLDEATGASETFGNGLINLTSNLDELTDALVALTALATARYIPAIYAAVAAKIALTKATLTATPAVTGLSAAMGVQAARASTATIATNALAASARGVRAALGFLAGPKGLILLAVGALAHFATKSDDAEEATEGLNSELDEAIRKYKLLDEVARASEIDKITVKEVEARGKLAEINRKLAESEEEMKRALSSQRLNGTLSNEAIETMVELAELENQAKSLTDQLALLGEKKTALVNSTVPDIGGDSGGDSVEKIKETGQKRYAALLEQYQNETDLLDGQLQIQQQIRSGALSEAEGEIYASFLAREARNREHYEQIRSEIESYYEKEMELLEAGSERAKELEQEKHNALAELRRTYDQQVLIMGEEQNAALEEQAKGFFERLKGHIQTSAEDFDAIWGNTFDRFAQGIGDATATAIMEQKSFGDVARTIAKTAIRELISGLVQLGVKYAAMKAIELATNTSTAAATTAANVAAATASTAAWTPAAAMASLASFGANAAPAMAGITSTVALAKGMSLAGIAHDGLPRATSSNEGTYLVRRDEMVLNPRQRENFDAMREAFENGGGKRQGNQYSFNPQITINAEGAAPGMEEQIRSHVETALTEFDNRLQEDFASNGQRAQLLSGRAA